MIGNAERHDGAMTFDQVQRGAAATLVIDKIERGEQPTKAELTAAGLCTKCAGFGFIGYEDDGFTEIPCNHCRNAS